MRRLVLITTLVLVLGAGALHAAEPSDVSRSVRGEVTAINTSATPPVIVVRAATPDNKELIVGATIQPTTTISRGNEPSRLEDINVGESVVVRYQKRSDGLVALSIQAPAR